LKESNFIVQALPSITHSELFDSTGMRHISLSRNSDTPIFRCRCSAKYANRLDDIPARAQATVRVECGKNSFDEYVHVAVVDVELETNPDVELETNPDGTFVAYHDDDDDTSL